MQLNDFRAGMQPILKQIFRSQPVPSRYQLFGSCFHLIVWLSSYLVLYAFHTGHGDDGAASTPAKELTEGDILAPGPSSRAFLHARSRFCGRAFLLVLSPLCLRAPPPLSAEMAVPGSPRPAPTSLDSSAPMPARGLSRGRQ